jgi:galactoside O-acetyltransferase
MASLDIALVQNFIEWGAWNPKMTESGFYTEKELYELGFAECGTNVFVSRATYIGGPSRIRLGSNIRIDDFTSLSVPPLGFLEIGSNVHIGSGLYLGCGGGIVLENFAGLSQGVRIYSASDDFSGEYLTNPTIPDLYRHVTRSSVFLREHTIVGSGSVILPGVELEIGVAVGALSLVNRSLSSWGIYSGTPAKFIKARSKKLLSLETEYEARLKNL